jgi:mannose-6-phosphate isomerase-like protein (cupin superfamily)
VTHASDAVQPSIPPDDPNRHLTIARADEDQLLRHLGIVADTYTILVSGNDTAGRYTVTDVYVPPEGGPLSYRHDFKEMFTVLEGEIELSVRDQHLISKAGERLTFRRTRPTLFETPPAK